MKPEFLPLSEKDRLNNITHKADVVSETTGQHLALVMVMKFEGMLPKYVCSCWPVDSEGWTCAHIIVTKAAVEAALRAARSGPLPPAAT